MNKEEKVCRLCLTVINCETYVINKVAKHMIGVLLLKVDLSATSNPVMCTSCSERLQKFYNFMTACVQANRRFRFSSITEDTNVDCLCRLCKHCAEKELLISVTGVEKKSDVIREMLMKCMPELNLSSIADFFICRHCLDSLNGYFSFMTACQSIEEKIKECRKTEGAILNTKVDLSKIVETFSSNIELTNAGQDNANIIKNEETLNEKNEVVNITVKDEYLLEEDQQFKAVDEYAVESDRLCDNTISQPTEDPSDSNDILPFKCSLCPYETKYEGRYTRHLKTHKDGSELKMYRCDRCPFKSKRKYHLEVHMVTHKDLSDLPVYKCDQCPYQAKHRVYLKRHLSTHKDRSEMLMYNCAMCSYKTTARQHYRIHLQTHETKMYKCESCPYETKRRKYFVQHLLAHESNSEVMVYSCEKCPYKTIQKRCFTLHGLTHKDISETTAYKCELCPYVTKRKHAFNKHTLVHKDKSEVTMYKCEVCPYESKRRFQMGLHLVKHKDWSEIVTYKCGYCSYITKQEADFNEHYKSHQDKVKVTIFRCDLCKLEEKARSSFKRHLLTHLEITQVVQ